MVRIISLLILMENFSIDSHTHTNRIIICVDYPGFVCTTSLLNLFLNEIIFFQNETFFLDFFKEFGWSLTQ